MYERSVLFYFVSSVLIFTHTFLIEHQLVSSTTREDKFEKILCITNTIIKKNIIINTLQLTGFITYFLLKILYASCKIISYPLYTGISFLCSSLIFHLDLCNSGVSALTKLSYQTTTQF